MPKSAKDEQLKKTLQRYFEFELKKRLIDANNGISSRTAYMFSHQLIQSDVNIREQIELLSSEILNTRLTKAAYNHLLNNIDKIPVLPSMIDSVFEEVNSQFINAELPCLNHKLSLEITERIRNELSHFLQELFGETDRRVYATQERNVRRMDSLARLFTLSSSLSVCSAVTFYEGKCIIAANLAKESDRDDVINALKQRFNIICEFIAEVKEMKTTEVPEVAEQYYNRFVAVGGSNFQREIVTQALCKFAHAVCKDVGSFPENFRRIFTEYNKSNYLIILPALSPSNAPQLRISNYSDIALDYDIEDQPFCETIKLIHAEQLIAWYIFEINAASQETLNLQKEEAFKLPLGISKLSCKTCQENLSSLPLDIRGTHQQSYPEVLGLFTHNREPRDPARQFKSAVTFAERSHPGTIFDSNSESSNTSPEKKSISFGSFNGSMSQPAVGAGSRARFSRTLFGHSSAPHNPMEKGMVAVLSEPGRSGFHGSIFKSPESKINREIVTSDVALKVTSTSSFS